MLRYALMQRSTTAQLTGAGLPSSPPYSVFVLRMLRCLRLLARPRLAPQSSCNVCLADDIDVPVSDARWIEVVSMGLARCAAGCRCDSGLTAVMQKLAADTSARLAKLRNWWALSSDETVTFLRLLARTHAASAMPGKPRRRSATDPRYSHADSSLNLAFFLAY